MKLELKPAVILDRDGVINRPIWRDGKATSPRTLEEFSIYYGVKGVVTKLKKKGYPVLVATNQPGLDLKEFSREVYDQMCTRVIGLGVDEIFTCDHGLNSTCDCRKPKPGLLRSAAEKWKIDLPRSYFVGDSATDIQAADAAGCIGILLRTPDNRKVSAKREINMLGFLPNIIPDLPQTPAR